MTAPAGTRLIEAHYVPKKLIHETQADGSHKITVRAPSVACAIIWIVLVYLSFLVVPLAFAAFSVRGFQVSWGSGIFAALVALAVLIGIGYLAWLFLRPSIFIDKSGVRVGSRFFAIEDIESFRDYSDDWWVFPVVSLLKLEAIGIQYGIYSVHIPYLLDTGEAQKGAIYMTKVLKSMTSDIGKERDLKIQQADVF